LIGLGAANIASSLIGAFPVAASQSRTIVNIEAGGQNAIRWGVQAFLDRQRELVEG